MVKNHGISENIIENAFDAVKRFYDMSLDKKEEVQVSDDYAYGFTASENLSLSKDNEYISDNEENRMN